MLRYNIIIYLPFLLKLLRIIINTLDIEMTIKSYMYIRTCHLIMYMYVGLQDHHILPDLLPLCQLSTGGRGLDKDTTLETG